jgi:hypothetical protein
MKMKKQLKKDKKKKNHQKVKNPQVGSVNTDESGRKYLAQKKHRKCIPNASQMHPKWILIWWPRSLTEWSKSR